MCPSKKDGTPNLSVQQGVKKLPVVNPGFISKSGKESTVLDYVKRLLEGDRYALSRVITLIESKRTEHNQQAKNIINQCLPHAGRSLRIGVSGIPGVGKSTFIETFGTYILSKGHKLAVLVVDPSSPKSKGSILGDKTRMPGLSKEKNAFIRPSPAGETLGGVARKTRETITLCEAAGYDIIIVETVGVGQSEISVHSMVDFFLLLLLPGAGDELQGIKRGIVELANLIVVNKADGDRISVAQKAQQEYRNAIHLFPSKWSGWQSKVFTCSSLSGQGVPEIWNEVQQYAEYTKGSGFFKKNRQKQALHWLNESIQSKLEEWFYGHPAMKEKVKEVEYSVESGSISPFQGAEILIKTFLKKYTID